MTIDDSLIHLVDDDSALHCANTLAKLEATNFSGLMRLAFAAGLPWRGTGQSPAFS